MVTVFESYRESNSDHLVERGKYTEVATGREGIVAYLVGIGFTEDEAWFLVDTEGYVHVENRYFVLDIKTVDDYGFDQTYRLIAEETPVVH